MIDATAPGSGFYHTVKIALVIAVVTLMNSCLCAPTTDPSSPWWFQPCTSEIRLRHSRSTKDSIHFNPVRQQFRVFISQLKDSKKKIDRLYTVSKNQQGKPKVPHAKLPWLKLKKLLSPIRKASGDQRLDEMYIALQYFARTLDTLWKLTINTHAVDFNNEKRRSIYFNIMNHLRSLLCEMQDDFKSRGKTVPNGILSKKMKIPTSFSRTKSLDFTAGHLIDINFFKKMSSFVKRSNSLLKVNKRKSVVSGNSSRT